MKYRIFVAILVLCLCLAGCNGNESVVDPTVVTDATVVPACPDGTHVWRDATCVFPKQCTVCGRPEGSPVDHVWSDATYEEPSKCVFCGIENGDPVLADYETLGLEIYDVVVGGVYEYTTRCITSESEKTTGLFEITGYEITDIYDSFGAGDGYEWLVMSFVITFSDENALEYGALPAAIYDDYYDMGERTVTEKDDIFTLTWHGVDYDECRYIPNMYWYSDDDGVYLVGDAVYKVPVGYDGMIFALYDAANSYETAQHYSAALDSASVIVRLR